jgi:hypothetical protein
MYFTQVNGLINQVVFVTNKSIFTRWLRSKQLPILLSFMLIAVAAMQSLHDQLDHDALGTATHCEFCLLSHGAEGGLIPLAISLPTSLVDQAPEIFLPLVLPLVRNYSQSARAPPFISSL